MKIIPILLIMTGFLIMPAPGFSVPRDIYVAWENYEHDGNLAGFRLYHHDNVLCETADPEAIDMNCRVDLPDGQTFFALTAFFQDGEESAPSAPFSSIFSNGLSADFTADILQGKSPLTVSFDASPSTGNITRYAWSFGDGETGSNEQITHTFIAAGLYTVSLQVTDHSGATDQKTVIVTATGPSADNTAPRAVISSSTAVGSAPIQIQFDGSGSSDSDGRIISYEWVFGDGGTAAGVSVTHAYLTTGSFNATLTVTDNGGLTDSASTPILVGKPPERANLPPVAAISVFSYSSRDPQTFFFSAENSIDPDGTITSYSWNFGDGTTGSGITAVHAYPTPGVYEITLRVNDNAGAISPTARFMLNTRDKFEEKKWPAMPHIFNLLLRKAAEQAEP